MGFYYAADVAHAAVAHPHAVFVEYLVQRVALREMFAHQVYELSGDVSFHRCAERWVEPRDFSFSLPLFFSGWLRVFKFRAISSLF